METEKLLKTLDLKVYFPHNGVQNKDITEDMTNVRRVLFSKSSQESEILDCIIETHVGPSLTVSDIRILNAKSKCFGEVKAKHKSINYYKLFQQKRTGRSKKFFNKNKKVEKQKARHFAEIGKCENQVHVAEIQESFRMILHKVISKQLLGVDRNRKKILKTLQNFLRTAKTESFSLLPLLEKLNISSMTWINLFQDQNTRYILAAKFIKWLFQYFIVIMWKQFHVAYVREERIFIRIQDWKKQEKTFFKKMTNKMALEPVGKEISIDSIQNRFYFVPKSVGIRSVVVHKYTNMNEKQDFRKASCTLKYLYETVYDTSNKDFGETFIKVIRAINKHNKNTVYMISTDICDAYGSIRPAKLFDIVESMFESLPDELSLQWYPFKGERKYKYLRINSYLSASEMTTRKIEMVTKKYILKIIKVFIFETKIKSGNKAYNLCKGVAQGLMLSAVLCNIYYADMRKKHFVDFENTGYLFTYVDDSIYITKSLNSARKYLKKIRNGIPEYNCWYNESKLRSNLNNNKDKDSAVDVIEFLGWKIDSKSFEVEAKYNSARYSINYLSLDHWKLEYKLKNFSSLKLDKIILCKEVNSNDQILNNVKTIYIHQAERCFALMTYLHGSQSKTNFKLIQKHNFKILKRIETLTNWDENEKKKNRFAVKYIMWKSYLNIFNKRSDLFCDWKKTFEKLVKKFSMKK